MKVKYLAMFATVSILSVSSLVIGCANPCAAQDKGTDTTETTTGENPCAGKENPCAGQ